MYPKTIPKQFPINCVQFKRFIYLHEINHSLRLLLLSDQKEPVSQPARHLGILPAHLSANTHYTDGTSQQVYLRHNTQTCKSTLDIIPKPGLNLQVTQGRLLDKNEYTMNSSILKGSYSNIHWLVNIYAGWKYYVISRPGAALQIPPWFITDWVIL